MSDRWHSAASSGVYPERQERRPSTVEKAVRRLAYLPWRLAASATSPRRFADIDAAGADPQLQLRELRYDLRRYGLRDDLVARALGLLARQANSAIGRMPAGDELAAASLLVRGRRCVELDSIESWTLAAALAAGTVALAGIPAHIIVVTGFIAKRDAGAMRAFFESVGLSVGVVDDDTQEADRRAAYAADVAYCVHRAIALDYLRDRMVLKGRPRALRLRTEALTSHNPRTQHLMLRGLQFAIACEAETILVDAAQWPVTITAAASGSQEANWLGEALQLSRTLAAGGDYQSTQGGAVQFTDSGSARLAEAAKPLGGHWQGRKRREDIVSLALVADRFLAKGEHYMVDGENLQVGEEVLRLHAPEQGAGRLLKILLELKESCTVTGTREVLARIGYQRFFRRYLRSGALAASAADIGSELWSIYGLSVVRFPSPGPGLQVALPDRMAATQAALVDEVCGRVRELHDQGIPVLIVTRTPQASVAWSDALKSAGLENERLVGVQSEQEAATFHNAGTAGRVTVAPYYVARGDRIGTVREIEETGGLRVIIVQLPASRRHQYCLIDRCIPPGVSGSVQRILSLEDDLICAYVPSWLRRPGMPFSGLMLRLCQWRAGREYAHARDELFRMEDYLGDVLAFSGGQH